MSGPFNVSNTYDLTKGKKNTTIKVGFGDADQYIVNSSKKFVGIFDPKGDHDKLKIVLKENESVFLAGTKGETGENSPHIEIRKGNGKGKVKVKSKIYCKGIDEVSVLQEMKTGELRKVENLQRDTPEPEKTEGN